MTAWKYLGASILIVSVLSAQQAIDDPVMKARSQRASIAGSGGDDLPPVPRAILEPPPLPPPVAHVKDTRGYRSTRRVKKVKGKNVKRIKGKPVAGLIKKKKIPKKKP